MPETPDFEQIARTILSDTFDMEGYGNPPAEVEVVAKQLRLVWNARGAADLKALEAEHHGRVDTVYTARDTVLDFESPIRRLDR